MQNDLKKAFDVLKSGGVILYPTDTIWGIGCDATNPEAVRRIYQIKKREDSKSMLILLENPAFLERYVNDVPEIAWEPVEDAEHYQVYRGSTEDFELAGPNRAGDAWRVLLAHAVIYRQSMLSNIKRKT